MTSPPLDQRTLTELIQLQKRLFSENQAKLQAAESMPPALFKEYEADYTRVTMGYERAASIDELLEACQQADVIYVADYHTLEQTQKTFVKLIQRMPKRSSRRLTLCMEFVQGRFQEHIDRYLAGRIAERTFLKRIEYKKHWPYDIWPNYRPIFQIARERSLPILGIEGDQSASNTLHARDSYAGRRIAKLFHNKPDTKAIVLIGELHIAPSHLPAIVQANLEKLGQPKRQLMIFQNCAEIYWTLLGRGQADTEVVQITEDSYCVINTPPIVQQQSYLNWLEYDEDALEYVNLQANFHSLVQAVGRFLRIKAGRAMDELAVFGPGETSFLGELDRRKEFSAERLSAIRQRIANSESFFIPETGLIYLGRLATNQAGEAATHFVRYVASGVVDERNAEAAFYTRTLYEAMGFFGSKILNHKRKCAHERSYHQTLARVRRGTLPETDTEAIVAAMVVTHKRWEKGISTKGFDAIFEQESSVQSAVSRSLGYMLGEKLYYALVRGNVQRAEVRDLFERAYTSESAAAATYFHWRARVGTTRIPKRI